ncbi:MULTISPECIES: sensor histidine kinase [Brevundimonas]|uniref:histidine kinase n=1 Tax=Brevundimonas fontaquae TaxID=2813778 RepID=A0ABX7LRQ5_9CAUL|nr:MULTISPECIES: CHASE3 domain-containing protein [Brevundimonas]QSF55488.1 CHASE3 domain-containing protein [Brevundimonas fontaquae]WBT07173.1 CHASE3 domain-containing protein [Brevundimonas vesicularis]
MSPNPRSQWSRLRDFMRTPSLARSISAMLILAFGLLIVVNATTFVMIQRTFALNETIEHAQQMRRAARTVLIASLNAETSQRGFLLTGRSDFLQPYRDARADMEPALAFLDEGAALDPTLKATVEPIHRLGDKKWDEMENTVALARQGRIGQAIQAVRSGEGKQYMDELRAAIEKFDKLKSDRIDSRRRASEVFGLLTVTMNAIAGLLVIVLALLSAWLVRRYVSEIQSARATLDAANASLEDKVRERTGDLMRANEEIQRFAYIVSHDLRAPLVNVMGYTSELEQAGKIVDKAIYEAEKTRVVDPEIVTAVREEMPEAIGFIRASTEKMDRLINAILKLSREGRRNLLPEPLDMTAMAQNIANSVHHQTEASGARIEVQSLPEIESDRISMEQIVGNLIDNAVKYLDHDRPGEIVVSGEDVPGGWVVYRVADNGRGIAPRDHERIFELFRRSGRQDRSGEGLGLAFVRNSVRRLGGTIDVESELGKGSTFLLKFPKRLILSEPGGAL